MGDNSKLKSSSPIPTTLHSGGASSNSLAPLVDEILLGSSPSSTTTTMIGSNDPNSTQLKKTPNDFLFLRQIGEGSFSMVFKGRELETGREFAIKTCEKRLLKKERKVPYVMREKEVMTILNKNPHPFFVRLYCTFQDDDRLYFVMTLAANGEILDYLRKLGCFDEPVTRFYAAEIVLALEHLHRLGIVHRDLKPENILVSEDMHILVSDFGSAKILHNGYSDAPTPLLPAVTNRDPSPTLVGGKRASFVGTAQYVSPEVLNGQPCTPNCDFWAVGCIMYQMLAGLPPFRAANEFLIFQKINKLEYSFPDGFLPVAKELVQDFLKLEPDDRLGSEKRGGMEALKAHPFFAPAIEESGLDAETWWTTLPSSKPPAILPYLPSTDGSEAFHSNYRVTDNVQPGLDDFQLTRLMGLDLAAAGFRPNVATECSNATVSTSPPISSSPSTTNRNKNGIVWNRTADERKTLLEKQRGDRYHRFVEGNLILKSGLVDKRKGLFARRRMLLLTEGPHMYYVDPVHMELKGQIPWSKQLRPEAKNFRIFFVHTTHRTYYLEDPTGRAIEWCEAIEQVRQYYLDSLPATNVPPKKP